MPEDIQHLEAEATEEERRDCLAFLAACGTALRASSCDSSTQCPPQSPLRTWA